MVVIIISNTPFNAFELIVSTMESTMDPVIINKVS